MAIEITVRDTDSGAIQTQTITDDFVVIAAGRHYVAHRQVFAKSGTHQITIKVNSGDAP